MRIGVDAGGTFTDAVRLTDDGEFRYHKRLSTPARPEAAVVAAVRQLAGETVPRTVAHGSTVATNAFLEGRTAPVGLITTAGLEDVVAIGRQRRRRLYALRPEGRRSLVSQEHVIGVSARVTAGGIELEPIDPDELRTAADSLERAGAGVLVLGLLHSARHPEHEREALAVLQAGPGPPVVASHRVTVEPREVERWTTAIVAAGLSPVVSGYVTALGEELAPVDVRVMLSNGGLVTPGEAVEEPAATLLSGPAAGVVGARFVSSVAGFDRIVTLDMGGTSCDVAVVPGEIVRTTETEIDEIPITIPMIDIQTVGAGGGSIARVDAGGALVVGPESAGAVPGPACYGTGGERPTVTDAHLVLGHLDPERFAAAGRRLDRDRAEGAIGALAGTLDVTLAEAAAAVLAAARSRLERTVRRATLERGHDPAHFTLVAFGGAGGLHVAALADALGAGRALVPRAAGVLSALGCLVAETRIDVARTILAPLERAAIAPLERRFADLEARAVRTLADEGVSESDRVLARSLELRYRGQSHATPVTCGRSLEVERLATAFHRRHAQRYGYARPEAPVEIVAARVAGIGRGRSPAVPEHVPDGGSATDARIGLARGETFEAAAWSWSSLPPDHTDDGPAVVFGEHATALVPADWSWRVDRWGNVVMERGA